MTATPKGSERAAAADSDYSTSAVGLLSRHRKYKCMASVYRITPRALGHGRLRDSQKGAERAVGLGGYDAVAEGGELFVRGEPEVGMGHPSVR